MLQTSFLGDVVLTTPLIARLAERGSVDVVATPASAGLLANHPGVRRLLVFDKRGRDAGFRGLRRIAREVRAPSRDAIAYCVQGSWRTSAIAWLAGYRERVGFDTSAGRMLYTRRVPYRRDEHHARRLLDLAGGEVDSVAGYAPMLYPGEPERAAVDALLAGGVPPGMPLIALAPGSVWATKRWPWFADAACVFSRGAQVIVVGSMEDKPLARTIVDATGRRAIDATGRLSLLASAELIRRCALLVTNDSAPQHLASAVGTPTITIFGPTVPAFGFGPLAPRSVTVGHPSLPCRPCHPHGPATCPLGHWQCMREVRAGDVLEAAEAILHRGAP